MNVEKLIKKAREATSSEMSELVGNVLDVLRDERKSNGGLCYLPSKGNAVILGDLHGDLESLSFVLKHGKFLERRDHLIFLGDYGDRGLHSPEVYFVIFSLKGEFPNRVILLRGNHESTRIPFWPHDLQLRLVEKYRSKGKEIYEKIREVWDYLYLGAILKGKYLLLHAGIPVGLHSKEDLILADGLYPEKTFLEEILWSDPIEGKGFYPSPRGAGRLFGKDVTQRVLKLIEVKALIRSHQPPAQGTKVSHDGLILTISSTKVYGGKAAYLPLTLSEKAKDAYELEKIAHKF